MQIEFFHDPHNQPRSREDVRLKQIGVYVHDQGPKVTFGAELTPFLERPCLDVAIMNGEGQPAGSLTVIETLTPNFSLVMHLRDGGGKDPYELTAVVFYMTPETPRIDVDQQTISFSTQTPGEILFPFEV